MCKQNSSDLSYFILELNPNIWKYEYYKYVYKIGHKMWKKKTLQMYVAYYINASSYRVHTETRNKNKVMQWIQVQGISGKIKKIMKDGNKTKNTSF